MQKFSLNKGFTLIELLVVIAILGILAAVVLIAINPAERIAEANDTQVRSDISTVASAIEACFTGEASGFYDQCMTTAKLTGGEYLKTNPSTTISYYPATDTTTVDDVAEIVAYAPLEAEGPRGKFPSSCTAATTIYYAYYTFNGQSYLTCGAPSSATSVVTNSFQP